VEIVHFAWLFEKRAFCNVELKADDKVATPLVIALNEGCELCKECLRVERTEAPQPEYDLRGPLFW